MAAFIGCIILRLAGKDSFLVNSAQSINLLAQEMIAVITKAIPIVVFVSLFELVGGKLQIDLASVYRYPVFQAILTFGWLLLVVIRVSVTRKVRLSTLIKNYCRHF